MLTSNQASIPPSPTLSFQRTKLVTVELNRAIPELSAVDADGGLYEKARVLVRLYDWPLCILLVSFEDSKLDANQFATIIWEALADRINDRLGREGLAKIECLPVAGLQLAGEPASFKQRAEVLAEAPMISVVVCTRDRVQRLHLCLQSLLALNYPCFEIIVVDNKPSTSATADLIREYYQHEAKVRYIREDRLGVTVGRNMGLQQAQGSIVAFTDDDAVVDVHWLTAIAEGFQTGADVGCVTGLTMPLEIETYAQSLFEDFGGFNRNNVFEKQLFSIRNIIEQRRKDPLFPYTPAKFGAGVNTAFRVSAFREVGGFDPALGPGTLAPAGEEIDVFFRLIMQGYTIAFNPGAIVHHQHRRDYEGLRRQLYNYGIGMTAFLTRSLVQRPYLIFDILSKIPYVIYYLASASSPKHAKKQYFPAELAHSELRGLLYGPVAYAQSYWRTRNVVRQLDPQLCGIPQTQR